MATTSLNEAVLLGALRHTHFFNGRLLTAGDLRTEQRAVHEHLRRLGRAVGDGVVHGLDIRTDVANPTSTLVVSAGLAINRCGDTLGLAEDAQLAWTAAESNESDAAGIFRDCVSLSATDSTSSTGLWLLVAGPASGTQERAPKHGFGDEGSATQCDARYEVEGVYFRRASLSLSLWPTEVQSTLSGFLAATAAQDLAMLRNLAAHGCFGTLGAAEFARQPSAETDGGSAYRSYGIIDHLRSLNGLTDAEVPLALVFENSAGLQWVDVWAARRPPVRREESSRWPLLAGSRRSSEGRALLDHFQEHLLELLGQSVAGTVKAKSWFRFLPPVGFLPVGSSAFDESTFFDGLKSVTGTLDPAYLRALFEQSWFVEPLDLESDTSSLVIFTVPGMADHRVFVRADATTLAAGGASPGAGAVGSAAQTGQIVIRLRADTRISGAKGRVYVVDEAGIEYDASLRFKGLGFSGTSRLGSSGTTVEFITDKLPTGTYLAQVSIESFQPASGLIKLVSSRAEAEFKLTPIRKGSTASGSGTNVVVTGSGNANLPYDKVAIVGNDFRWPWPPEELEDFDPVTDPPPYAVDWAIKWGSEFQSRFADAPISPGDATIYVKRDYDPTTSSDAPYAYIVYGSRGGYAPVLLVPTGKVLTEKRSVLDLDEKPADLTLKGQVQLVANGVDDLDVMAAAYTDLISAATGVPGTSSGIIDQARSHRDTLLGGI